MTTISNDFKYIGDTSDYNSYDHTISYPTRRKVQMTKFEIFEKKHPTIAAMLVLGGFVLGCLSIWGLAMLAKYIISII